MGDAAPILAPDAGEFITRGEFSDRIGGVQQDVKLLQREMVETQTVLSTQGGQLTQILANQDAQDKKLDNLQSVRQWIGWVLVIVTSTGVVQITSHLVGVR
ncbi:hypothetical protein HKD25_04555 [Gluconobacter wancherniae]|uniref:Uncharacterized protein n=2 Tax=Gluconobacter wancherniae TaxID=1307955 RepID=A0A511AY67_9PROT|nr:hypothetical protein [Gluconobacter wancherniae]GBD55947.1 hypothetical protein NBRC103581_00519 [Gluconobacter wancherniae NBRC 103581]GBR65835.1 hypothetical protein AA103581_2032 [Gluconobacter wancherniae NBRC 103581]GEK93149.1 hypothetical protein GWA01_09190 [Gluconobacter wancherniae NBRC 103581]